MFWSKVLHQNKTHTAIIRQGLQQFLKRLQSARRSSDTDNRYWGCGTGLLIELGSLGLMRFWQGHSGGLCFLPIAPDAIGPLLFVTHGYLLGFYRTSFMIGEQHATDNRGL